MAIKRVTGEAAPAQTALCAHVACSTMASVRIKVKTGWANLCKHHYSEHYGVVAKEFCLSRGLLTREAMSAFCRENIPTIGRRERVPGEDDEDIAA